jgi:hypothetical protein
VDYSLFWYLGHISTFISIVPVLLSVFIFKKLSPIQLRLVTLIIVLFTTELTANIVWRQQINNNPIYHVYAVVEFFLILRIFKLELTKLFTLNKFIIIFVSFLTFAIINVIVWQNIFVFNSNVTTLSSFLIVVLVLIYFYSLLQKENLAPLGRIPIFWISAGMMVYFSTNLILFFITKNETFELVNRHSIWSIHAMVSILSICFYTYALWIKPKTE